MDLADKLIDLVARSPITELEFEQSGVRIKLTKFAQGGPVTDTSLPGAAPPPKVSAGLHEFKALMGGVFYRSAGENDLPLVNIGDVVEEGQKIGLLEAMKTFNALEAPQAGRIVRIGFDDKNSVNAGDVLFVIEEVGAA